MNARTECPLISCQTFELEYEFIICIVTLLTLEVINYHLECGTCPREMFRRVLKSFKLINAPKAIYVSFCIRTDFSVSTNLSLNIIQFRTLANVERFTEFSGVEMKQL